MRLILLPIVAALAFVAGRYYPISKPERPFVGVTSGYCTMWIPDSQPGVMTCVSSDPCPGKVGMVNGRASCLLEPKP